MTTRPTLWPLTRAALAARRAPLALLIRDDDAGWDDARLLALLDVVHGCGAAIDLAVIPTALGDELAARLRARHDAEPALLGLHQHGYSHTNHEPQGRKCEFGSSRAAADCLCDLADGQARLRAAFGRRLDAIFTPPWNRCGAQLPPMLSALGYAALSRDAGAASSSPQPHLPELAVHVDWSRVVREVDAVAGDRGAALDAALAAALGGAGAHCGVMLHHAAMDAAEHALLASWLRVVRASPEVRSVAMREVLARRHVAPARAPTALRWEMA